MRVAILTTCGSSVILAAVVAWVWLQTERGASYKFAAGPYREVWISDGEVALLQRGDSEAVVHSLATVLCTAVAAPFVALLVILGVGRWVAFRARRFAENAADRARVAGKCRQCGYDLRATPGRCPECGTTPTAGG